MTAYALKLPDDNKVSVFTKISLASLFCYICTLYVLAYSASYNIISKAFFALTIVATLLEFLATRQKIKPDRAYLTLVLFVIYAFITSLWAVNPEGVNSTVSTLAQLLVLFIVIRLNIRDERSFKVFLNALYTGSLIMCLYTILFYGPAEIISRISQGLRIGDEINQANSLGFYSVNLSLFALYYVMVQKKYIHIVSVLASVLVLLGSGSRKCFLVLAMGFALLLIFKSKKGKMVRFLVVLLLCLYALYFIEIMAENNYFFYRISEMIKVFSFGAKEYDDNSIATRLNMIELAIDLFKENPIFGYGSKQYEHFYALTYGLRRPPHSTFFQLIVSYGSIGALLFYSNHVYAVVQIVKSIIKKNKYATVMIITFASVFMNEFASNMLTDKFTFIYLALFTAYVAIIKKGGFANVDNDADKDNQNKNENSDSNKKTVEVQFRKPTGIR